MRTYDEIQKEIEETRAHLTSLYKEQKQTTYNSIPIKKHKLYRFSDPTDTDIEYCGVIYDFWFEDNALVIQLCGLQKCLSNIIDSCWASFDTDYEPTIPENYIDILLKNITEISEEEFNEYIDNWKFEITTYLTNNINNFLNNNNHGKNEED